MREVDRYYYITFFYQKSATGCGLESGLAASWHAMPGELIFKDILKDVADRLSIDPAGIMVLGWKEVTRSLFLANYPDYEKNKKLPFSK